MYPRLTLTFSISGWSNTWPADCMQPMRPVLTALKVARSLLYSPTPVQCCMCALFELRSTKGPSCSSAGVKQDILNKLLRGWLASSELLQHALLYYSWWAQRHSAAPSCFITLSDKGMRRACWQLVFFLSLPCNSSFSFGEARTVQMRCRKASLCPQPPLCRLKTWNGVVVSTSLSITSGLDQPGVIVQESWSPQLLKAGLACIFQIAELHACYNHVKK